MSLRETGRQDALRTFKLAADVLTSFNMPGARNVAALPGRAAQATGGLASSARRAGGDAARRLYQNTTARLGPGKGALLGLLAGGTALSLIGRDPTYTINPSAGYAPVYP